MKKILNHKYTNLIVLIIIYVILRLYNLTLLPIFTDESIYLYWGKFIQTEKAYWFISITDGKPPILPWIYAALFQIFDVSNYLFLGRIVSVIYGLISLIFIYKLSELLFKNRLVAIVASVLYIISPFMTVYDRLAVYDSQLTAMLLGSVYFMFKTSITGKFKYALLWGVFLGLGLLSKPPAIIYVGLTPLIFCFFYRYKNIKKDYKKFILLLISPIVSGMIIGNLVRVSSAYSQMQIKNSQFQVTISDFVNSPLALLGTNLEIFNRWLVAYYTVPFYFFGIIAFVYLIYRDYRKGLSLFALWAFPIIVLGSFGVQTFPRYLVFITPYIIIVSSYLFIALYEEIKLKKIYRYLLITIIFFILFYKQIQFDYFLLTNPYRAPLPIDDKTQLVSQHPSGYGLDKVFEFLRNESRNKKITVVTQGTFGLYPYAFYFAFWGNPNVNIIPKWPLDRLDQSELGTSIDIQNTFFIIKEKITPELSQNNVVLVSKKPGGEYPIHILKIKNN